MYKNKERLFNCLIYVVFAILLFFIVSQKVSYHIDGFYSYNLANCQGDISIDIENDIRYEPASKPFLDYLSVDENHTFDYSNVWKNQTNDVHPPLYYVLLHTVSSFFPETFSKWYACSINIVAILICLFFVQKIIKLLTDDKFIYYLVSVLFTLTTGILDSVGLCRMYVLTMLWITIGSYLFINQIDKKNDYKFYIKILLVAYLGAMTHYYVIVYFAIISITYGTYLLIKKKWKDVVSFILSMCIAGLFSIITFPAMINHIFSGYRGIEATSNLINLDDFISRLTSFFNNVSNELFGNKMLYVLILLILVVIIRTIKDKKINNTKLIRYVVLIIPTITYFVLVSKIAAYINERYMSIIYAMSICWIYCLMFDSTKIIANKYYKSLITAFSLVVLALGLFYAEWTYTYRDSSVLVEKSKEYSNLDCVCINKKDNSNTLYNCVELMNYNSITFIEEEHLNNIDKIIKTDEAIIKFIKIDNKEEIINNILFNSSKFNNYELLGSARNGATYHLY